MRVEYINPFVETSYRVLKEVLGGAVSDDPRRFLAREKSRDGAAVTQYRSGANQTLALESRACAMRVHRYLACLERIRTLSVSKSRWFVGRLPCQRCQLILLGQPSGQQAAACIPDRVLCVPFGRAFICCQCDALDILQTARHASSGWDKRSDPAGARSIDAVGRTLT